VIELCISKLSCVDLAAIASSSRCLQAAVQALGVQECAGCCPPWQEA
jgi:hypothetical protein